MQVLSETSLTPFLHRWYRPPELLWGSRSYSFGIDIWSMGTIFVELVLRKPFLPGETDVDQLKRIIAVLGTPSDEDWPVSRLMEHECLLLG